MLMMMMMMMMMIIIIILLWWGNITINNSVQKLWKEPNGSKKAAKSESSVLLERDYTLTHTHSHTHTHTHTHTHSSQWRCESPPQSRTSRWPGFRVSWITRVPSGLQDSSFRVITEIIDLYTLIVPECFAASISWSLSAQTCLCSVGSLCRSLLILSLL